jgi:hypothetical protein
MGTVQLFYLMMGLFSGMVCGGSFGVAKRAAEEWGRRQPDLLQFLIFLALIPLVTIGLFAGLACLFFLYAAFKLL